MERGRAIGPFSRSAIEAAAAHIAGGMTGKARQPSIRPQKPLDFCREQSVGASVKDKTMSKRATSPTPLEALVSAIIQRAETALDLAVRAAPAEPRRRRQRMKQLTRAGSEIAVLAMAAKALLHDAEKES